MKLPSGFGAGAVKPAREFLNLLLTAVSVAEKIELNSLRTDLKI